MLMRFNGCFPNPPLPSPVTAQALLSTAPWDAWEGSATATAVTRARGQGSRGHGHGKVPVPPPDTATGKSLCHLQPQPRESPCATSSHGHYASW